MRFHEELAEKEAAGDAAPLTSAALDYIARGCDNQLLPESKPWLGRVLFEKHEIPGANGAQTDYDFDLTGEKWIERYKNGVLLPKKA